MYVSAANSQAQTMRFAPGVMRHTMVTLYEQYAEIVELMDNPCNLQWRIDYLKQQALINAYAKLMYEAKL